MIFLQHSRAGRGVKRASRPAWVLVVLMCLATMIVGCVAPIAENVSPKLVKIVAEIENPSVVIERATNSLVRKCMAKAGFRMPEYEPVAAATETYLGMVGVFRSESQATSVGYVSVVRDSDKSPNAYYESLPAAARDAFDETYFGVTGDGVGGEVARVEGESGMVVEANSSGCMANAKRAIFGKLETALEWTLLRNEALGPMRSDPLPLGLEEKVEYSECMAKSGYSVDGFNAPEVAAQRFGQYRTRLDEPSKAEVEMSRADLGCQRELRIIPRLEEHYARVARPWLLSNAGRLRVWQLDMQRALERARRVE